MSPIVFVMVSAGFPSIVTVGGSISWSAVNESVTISPAVAVVGSALFDDIVTGSSVGIEGAANSKSFVSLEMNPVISKPLL